MNKFGKVIVVTTLVIGLIGGVVLITYDFPPVLPSIFLAMAISVLVYHFMGGIKDASIKMGPVKMGGSIAALIGCAFIINHELEPQLIKEVGELQLRSNFDVVDADETKVGELPLNTYELQLNNKQHITLNQTIDLGEIEDSVITKLNLYDKITFANYTEVFYTLQMSPFKAALSSNPRSFLNAYRNLPFIVEPVFYKGCDKTKVTFSETDTRYYDLEKGETILINDFIHEQSIIYMIRVRQLDREELINEECFVQYQIISLVYSKNERPL